MINSEQILITEEEATSAAYGHSRREAVNPIAMARRRAVANAQLSKALWTIVDQLRTEGTLDNPSFDDLTAAAILEQIALILGSPHPTTQSWFDLGAAPRWYVQSADPVISRDLYLNDLED